MYAVVVATGRFSAYLYSDLISDFEEQSLAVMIAVVIIDD